MTKNSNKSFLSMTNIWLCCKLAWCRLINDYVMCDAFDAYRYNNPKWCQVMTITWSKRTWVLLFLSTSIELGKFHFYIMSERTLCYRTDNIPAKWSKSQKWKWKCGVLKMHVCVGWCVKWNSPWHYHPITS